MKTKNEQAFDQLLSLVQKEAEAKAANETENCGTSAEAKVKSEAVEVKEIDKNKVKATEEKQNKEQGPAQEVNATPAVASLPTPADTKTASSSVERLGAELSTLLEQHKQANATQNCGTAADSRVESKGVVVAKIDKNKVKATANNPQGPVQQVGEKTPDSTKKASYALGRAWADALIKKAHTDNFTLIKEAGRKDFETLLQGAAQKIAQNRQQAQIAQAQKQAAAAEMQKRAALENIRNLMNQKTAEAAKRDFMRLQKEAQLTQLVKALSNKFDTLHEKAAELLADKELRLQQLNQAFEEKQAALSQKVAEERENQKFAAWSQATANTVLERMRSELLK